MGDARYVYCIVEGGEKQTFGKTGLFNADAFVVNHRDIGAVVSAVPYREIQSNLDNILAHQRVVEAARKTGTTLPVKFGIIFKTEEGVKTLLTQTYSEYKAKITKLRGKDEFGVKVLVNNPGLERIRTSAEDDSAELKEMKKELASSGEGTSYFLKIKMDEALKSEVYRRIDKLSKQIHNQFAKLAEDNSLLKSDHAQIVLNAAYLVDRKEGGGFLELVKKLKESYSKEGLIIHMSGPWAPYSFC